MSRTTLSPELDRNQLEDDNNSISEDEGSVEDDMASVVGSDDEEETMYTRDVQDMMTVYERNVKVRSSLGVRSDILRFVRRLVIPHVKFTCEGSTVGSFEKPDFTDKDSWYYVVLKKAGYGRLSARNLAKVWVTYRKDVAEAFSNHRSNATARMKKAFLAGELEIFYLIALLMNCY